VLHFSYLETKTLTHYSLLLIKIRENVNFHRPFKKKMLTRYY
jgi:hypothetical protein